jgi:hypothetical protein
MDVGAGEAVEAERNASRSEKATGGCLRWWEPVAGRTLAGRVAGTGTGEGAGGSDGGTGGVGWRRRRVTRRRWRCDSTRAK